jgi:hypothetical protein
MNIIFILLCLCVIQFNKTIANENTVAPIANNPISIMVKDYTLLGSDININPIINVTSYSLNLYNRPFKTEWISNIKDFFAKSDKENLVQKEVNLLNRGIITSTNSLLNMCDMMIEKTTSVLPLSYSYKFSTDLETVSYTHLTLPTID